MNDFQFVGYELFQRYKVADTPDNSVFFLISFDVPNQIQMIRQLISH